jgi:hypothetical protein
MCGFISFVVFVYIKYVFPKLLMVLNGIMYFQTIAGGANEKLSRQGKGLKYRPKFKGLVARCHFLFIVVNIQKYIPSIMAPKHHKVPLQILHGSREVQGVFLGVLGQDSNPGLPFTKPRHYTAP